MKIDNVVVISLEDYADYQDLKREKSTEVKVDYTQLTCGSVVILELDGQQIYIGDGLDWSKPFTLISYSSYLMNRLHDFEKGRDGKVYLTFVQKGQLVSFEMNKKASFVKKVISY